LENLKGRDCLGDLIIDKF